MKLNEIDYDIGLNDPEKPVSHSPWGDDPENPYSRAPAEKSSYLGAGVSGAAYNLRDQQSIVRVAHKCLRPADEDPYIKYMELVQANQGNPFVPKLYKIKRFVAPGNKGFASYEKGYPRNFYYVNMEKLTPVSSLTIGQLLSSYNLCIQTLEGEAVTLESLSGGILRDDEHEEILGTTIDDLRTARRLTERQLEFTYEFKSGLANIFEKYVAHGPGSNYSFRYMDLQYDIVNEQLITILDSLSEIAEKHGAGLDIHLNNVMYRPTQYGTQPVITDPFV